MHNRVTTWRIPTAIRAEIAAQPASLSQSYLAELYGISKTSIQLIRREYGVKANPRGWPPIWGGAKFHARGNLNIRWPFKPTGRRALEWAA